ncbi:MAG: hypothetical protein U9Q73_00460 [Nanoarchaeota archaeon]|nr:hypothetical protein [Nanoarchaeota archaeon]
MINKCKKGYKKVGGRCVSKLSYKIFGNFSDEVDIIKVAFTGTIISISGWLIFSGIFGLLQLDGLSDWLKIGVGFTAVLLLIKFGVKR